jgi:NHL repeat
MKVNIKRLVNLNLLIGLAVVTAFIIAGWHMTMAAQVRPAQTGDVPRFQPDPSFFKLPIGWSFSQVSDVACDEQDNVWVLQRPITIYPDEKTGPPVMEFDSKGNYMQGWGGPGEGYEWPEEEHAISIDNKGYVWISGNWNDDQILKFTKGGKFVKQFGHSGHKKTNTDTQNFWMPAAAEVYPKTNELFIADGYGNNRIIVIDPDTGAFKRMWGAFGNVPKDIPPRDTDIRATKSQGNRGEFTGGAEQFRTQFFLDGGKEPADMTAEAQIRPKRPAPKFDPNDPGPPQFNLVHDLKVSNDGLVYAADRRNRRVQVFTIEGKFLKSVFVDRWCSYACAGDNTQTAGSVAFSADPEQRFLYVGSRTPGRIWVYDRKTMQALYAFGRPGVGPGEFVAFHELNTDSKGNIYTADLAGYSAQKFVFMGLGPVPEK